MLSSDGSHESQSSNKDDNHNRRYSLFGSAVNSSTPPGSPVTSSDNLYRNIMNRRDKLAQNLLRRNTATGSAVQCNPGGSSVCQRCQKFEVDLTNTSDNLSATDAELKASRQVISLLQRQLELFQVEKEGLEKLIVTQANNKESDQLNETKDIIDADGNLKELINSQNSSPDDIQKRLMTLIRTQLYSKDEEIVKLKSSLKECRNEKEQMGLQVHNLEAECSLLRDNLALRDQTIVSLSNEVFEQSNSGDQRRQSSTAEVSMLNRQHQKQLMKLNETLEAYKKTNELLTQNVIRLTDRCNNLERTEMESKSLAQELEARCCQIQSKLLSLLKEIEQSSKQVGQEGGDNGSNQSTESESVKLLIKRLLEDKSLDIPLSWKEGNRPRTRTKMDELEDSNKSECDELGFYLVPNETSAKKIDETTWRLCWDDFIKDFDKKNLSNSKEFKLLLRSGVPQEYRCKIWKTLIDLNIGAERTLHGPDYYQSLLDSKQTTTGPSSKQIELDLLRTLPNNKYFETIDSPGTVRLRKVLTAFASHEPHIGYCQGMNRLAAVALLVLPEEEAFWCLVSIVDKIMPTGYYNDLWLAQVDSNVVMDFVKIMMPDLGRHFQTCDIELSLFAWFLTIFVDGTPPALFLRLWDCFLYEGDKVMFRVALALLKQHEHELLQLNSSVSVNSFLRSSINELVDIDRFFKIAFEAINPLQGRVLRQKRETNFRAMRTSMKSISRVAPSPVELTSKDEDSQNEDSSIISI